VVIDRAKIRLECLLRNFVSFLKQNYTLLALNNERADELLDEGVPEEPYEKIEDRPGVVNDFSQLGKNDCDASELKMCPVMGQGPHMRERPNRWAHTLLANGPNMNYIKIEKQDLRLFVLLLCAGTSLGDVIPLKPKAANHMGTALRELLRRSIFRMITTQTSRARRRVD